MTPTPPFNQLSEVDQARLDELLDDWEDAQERGDTTNLEDLCADCPHLLAPLSARVASLQAVDDRLRTRTRKTELGHDNQGTGEDTTPSEIEQDYARLVAQSELVDLQFHDAGGLGKVYCGMERPLNREVAIKLIRQQNATHKEHRRNFLREAEITGRLEHPGVVAIYASGETIDGRCFYTMPMLRGGSLDEAIERYHQHHSNALQTQTVDFRDLIQRLISVCNTIAYAHSRGIVHRDLKPKNIMLGKYGETVVIDWGLAGQFSRDGRFKSSDENTLHLKHGDTAESSSRGFTLYYASPEQLSGEENLGPPSDIYSLGIILYKILTGRTPLSGLSYGQARQQARSGQAADPSRDKAGIPAPLAAICGKAIRHRATERYPTALDLAEDLQNYLADAPVSARRESPVEHFARFGRKHWQWALAVLVFLCCFSAFSLFSAVREGKLYEQARAASHDQLKLSTTLAAQAGAGEIDRRWRMLELEATSQSLRQAILRAEQTPADRTPWKDIQSWLDSRLIRFEKVKRVSVESMFINLESGLQAARAPASYSIGKNFSYRSYFHGLDHDLDPAESRPPARYPVISTVYTSTNDPTGKLKVAFSVPIWEHEGGPGDRVIGRLGMSVSVGDLQIFNSIANPLHRPLLVESRSYQSSAGDAFGLVIDHRSFFGPNSDRTTNGNSNAADLPEVNDSRHDAERQGAGGREIRVLAEELKQMMQLAPARLAESASQQTRAAIAATAMIDDFHDPLDPNGGTKRVAFCPICVTDRQAGQRETGWYVVLQFAEGTTLPAAGLSTADSNNAVGTE